jgi:cyclopropane-fatty-acyl-phospholipid synthase
MAVTSSRNWSPRKEASGTRPPRFLADLAETADVRFNGDRPWDINVHDAETYRHTLTKGTLGFGETYMEGYWDCDELDECIARLLRVEVDLKLTRLTKFRLFMASLANRIAHKLVNFQTIERAYQVGEKHYDIGNDLYTRMLDPLMNYSCGYWQHADSLAQAQIDKLDLVCRKLDLKPGDHLLDVGCGWGALARYAAEQYGVKVTGITISREQQELAQEHCRHLDVEILFCDYRKLEGKFNKIASIGMFEHVGKLNYKPYFDVIHSLLTDDGIMLLHTIGVYFTHDAIDPWINKYIFPNGQLPSASRIAKSIEPDLVFRDWHDFGPDYDKTLMAWWQNFDRSWPELADRYGQRFYRMWRYYLLSCAGFFRCGQGQLWQIVLTKRDAVPGYRSYRPLRVAETVRDRSIA